MRVVVHVVDDLPLAQATVAGQQGPRGYAGYKESLKPRYDLNKAKALMKEAGYENGFDVKVMAVNNKSYGTGIVQAILPMLKKIGINVIIEQVEGAVMTEKVYTSNDYEAYMSSFNTGPDDFYPIEAMQLISFNGETWEPIGEVIDVGK